MKQTLRLPAVLVAVLIAVLANPLAVSGTVLMARSPSETPPESPPESASDMSTEGSSQTGPGPAPDGNTARDGNIAIREEFDRAAELGTEAAWTLFLARHPGHPLAAAARDRLAALRNRTDPPRD
ncbi:hypothetical protein [Psychromarinibacter halotolerans]|uniref:Secreted protein n=1 Tax=Psychromarinibacter halotolerans TaxID=1775175 RepID=A0ABV7GKK3_9RHOB|nr:hypothetical protein [Psychromarinibacter halotolerans]MDF0598914.1 hypothetical protein [Psychromarinibacter halotolerans]